MTFLRCLSCTRARATTAQAFALSLLGIVSLGALSAAAPAAAAEATAAGRVYVPRFESYILTVADLDASVSFYKDLIGFELLRAPGAAVSVPVIQRLTHTPGARFRSATFRIPGTDAVLLLTEFTHIPHRALRPKNVDPGAATLVVSVRDMDAIVAKAAQRGTPVVTRGGAPLSSGGNRRAIVYLDPDGFYVNVSQLPQAVDEQATRPDGNIITAREVYTVDLPQTAVSFYEQTMGFKTTHGSFASSQSLNDLVDAPGAQFNSTHATPAESANFLEFVAFRNVIRKSYRGRPQDPGTAGFSLIVADLDATLQAAKSAGSTVVSAAGRPIRSGRNGASVFIRDPSGLLVELIQPAPKSP
jgi:catechol 2,3-dioxygenase-like lactoylglutathione lyase family enzyme